MSIPVVFLSAAVISIIIWLIEMNSSIRRLMISAVFIVALVILFQAIDILPGMGFLHLR